MKVLVIPDIHLKPRIFSRAAELMRQGIAERSICLMDIPDDWDQEFNIDLYLKTFDAAIEYAKEFPGTLWCYGNHDLSYVWGMPESGYSSLMQATVSRKLNELIYALPDPKQLAYIHRIDDVLFLHGGLTEFFVLKNTSPVEYDDIDAVIDKINSLGVEEIWNNDSPIWFRPQSNKYTKLYKEKILLQVVGHTPVKEITRDGNVISCDVFSTYRDGRPIGSQEFVILDTQTWEFEMVR